MLALAASDVVQDATALFIIGARARLAHVLEAKDFADLRAKETAGEWQFSRYFRSVCSPGFCFMTVPMAVVPLGGVSEYMLLTVGENFGNIRFNTKNVHRDSLHRTPLNSSPALIWSCSGTKTMIGKVSKINK